MTNKRNLEWKKALSIDTELLYTDYNKIKWVDTYKKHKKYTIFNRCMQLRIVSSNSPHSEQLLKCEY